jgi:hypothetical protein
MEFHSRGAGVTGDSLKSTLGHEMVHTWTAVDIGKWYSEGNGCITSRFYPGGPA